MSRRRRASKRPVPNDAKFQSPLVSRLVNTVMRCGKKSTAQRIVYGAFNQISEKNPASNPLEILQRAVDNAKPRLEVKARRVGGATYRCRWKCLRSGSSPWRCDGWLILRTRARAFP